jgi:hypothetical protein
MAYEPPSAYPTVPFPQQRIRQSALDTSEETPMNKAARRDTCGDNINARRGDGRLMGQDLQTEQRIREKSAR